MDYWRDYFRSANASIFEIIEGAIMLAATDCPKEFKLRRDGIAQTLLIKCSGCDKQELALPVDNKDHDHDVDVDVDGDEGVSYGDAEALTDEIEQESQTFGEVMRIKETVDNSPDESASVLCNSLRKLQLMSISVETLKATEIGKSVNVLRKHGSKDVRQIARTLIEVWKDMVAEWVSATEKMTVSENTPESMNPSVLDEEEGLPSPPLDDIAFLNPHSISLELSEKFFDDVDDFGNPRRNENRNNRKPPAVEQHNDTKWKQQKPLNGTTKVSKPTMVKPPVVDSTPGRRMNLNTDCKLQNPENPILPKRPAVPQQRKPMSLDGETEQDKLEATKRKLQERYQQAENVKRQRTIQVMELHDLPKQDFALKNQHTKPGHNHYRHWANGRF
ncbi:hypothetical protein M8C21_025478 [Ambrosia artemisiifolia]|uniref:TFIIS N-terminal domain-containing protein n=1 Tax=Ambrosia artemisiifolia TaxID=4212 RepID=A0AAD5C4C8_AMBAR|nr:hypothetical protein M8C21_025478 [Ambrosia artemisiifolia]